jgi:uncharacterized protein involved in exopolysaccharide biosynthesis
MTAFDGFLSILRHRRMILINLFTVTVLAAGVSLLLPKMYTARTIIRHPRETIPMLDLPSALSGAGIESMLGVGGELQSDEFVEILLSREILDRLIEEFDLRRLYKAEYIEDALSALEKYTDIEVSQAGLVRIEVTAPEPQLAADMANAYVRELDRFNRSSNSTQAHFTRTFLERRVGEVAEVLEKTEDTLQEQQEKHNTVTLPQAMLTMVSAQAELEARLQAVRVELGILNRVARPNHPKLVELRNEIRELESELNAQPKIQMDLARLMRDVKIQETLYALLIEQLERSRIQEVRDTPTVQVVERAQPPEKRSRPRRTQITLVAALLGLIFAVTLSLFIDFVLNDPDAGRQVERADRLREAWRGRSR